MGKAEFDSTEASERFDPPGWLERDVTGEPAYSNRTHAERGWPT